MRNILQSTTVVHLLPVQDREHLHWLVKESEMLTGRPGREFFLVGDDRPALHVRLDHSGYEIVADEGERTAAKAPRPDDTELRELTLDLAFSYGLLFTTPIQ
jgi:hypothetical protein